MSTKKHCAVLLALSAGAALVWQAGVTQAQMSRDEQLLSAAASLLGGNAAEFQIVDRVTRTYPLTAVRLEVAKVMDPATGQVRTVALDGDGKPVDASSAEEAERKARSERYGKIDARLHARLALLPAAQSVPVSIWLNVPDPPISRMQYAASPPDTALAAYLAALQQYMAPRREGVLRALQQMGALGAAPNYGPAVFARLTSAQIRLLARHPDVATIYGTEQYGRFSDDASTTTRAYRVWAASNLGVGTSSRPVVHEDDGIADYNAYLNNLTHPVVFWCSSVNASCPVGKNIGDHASEVAGIIASTHPLFRGVAPSAQMLLSANFQTFDPAQGFDQKAVDSLEWARGNGGDPINMSWGTNCGGFETFHSRYADWAVRNLAATLVIAAGNTTGICPGFPNDWKVSAPGLAWGVITVGSQFDNNNGFWSGDGMSGFSRYVNPDFATGMEKPEVVSVGENVRTTDDSFDDGLTPGGVNGTSFAAPSVAGQVVQMLSRKPGQNFWPEANKAAVLVSAYHDIVGGLGDKSQDGVGAVVMNNSDDTYRNNRFVNDSVDAAAAVGTFVKTYTIPLTVNQRVRVAIAWDSQSTGGSGTNQLGADLDLYVYRPDGTTLVSNSLSIDNAWEMVEFTAPVTGNFVVKVKLYDKTVDWPGTYMGMAWSVRSLPDFCTGATAISVASTFNGNIVRSINTANGSTFFDSYAGWGFTQSGREAVLKLTIAGANRNITVTDTNTMQDLHLVTIASCSADPFTPTVLDSGEGTAASPAQALNRPAGTYYVIVDGRNDATGIGHVGTNSVTINIAAAP